MLLSTMRKINYKREKMKDHIQRLHMKASSTYKSRPWGPPALFMNRTVADNFSTLANLFLVGEGKNPNSQECIL